MMKLISFMVILGLSISISSYAANPEQAVANKLHSDLASLQVALEKAIAVLKTDVVDFLRCANCKR